VRLCWSTLITIWAEKFWTQEFHQLFGYQKFSRPKKRTIMINFTFKYWQWTQSKRKSGTEIAQDHIPFRHAQGGWSQFKLGVSRSHKGWNNPHDSSCWGNLVWTNWSCSYQRVRWCFLVIANCASHCGGGFFFKMRFYIILPLDLRLHNRNEKCVMQLYAHCWSQELMYGIDFIVVGVVLPAAGSEFEQRSLFKDNWRGGYFKHQRH
jgi:hypothetical protein